MRNNLAHACRKLTSLSVVTKAFCSLYCFTLSLVYYRADSFEDVHRFFDLELSLSVSSLAYGIVGLGFLLLLLSPLWRRNESIIAPDPSTSIVPQHPAMEFITTYLGDEGYFGILGEYFEFRVVILQFIELLAQLYQSYSYSRNVSNPAVVRLHALLISIDFGITPMAIFKSGLRTLKKRKFTVTCEVIFDMLFGLGFPIMLMVLPFLQYAGNVDKVRSDVATATAFIEQAKQIIPRTSMSLFVQLVPIIGIMIGVSDLNTIERKIDTINVVNVAVGAKRKAAIASSSVPNTARFSYQLSKLKAMSYVTFVASIVVSMNVLIAPWLMECPARCKIPLYPLMGKKCHCMMLTVNCHDFRQIDDDGVTDDKRIDDLLGSIESISVRTVQLMRCEISTVPSSIEQLSALNWLEVHNSRIDRIEYNITEAHPVLSVLFIEGSELREVVPALLDLPRGMVSLMLSHNHIRELPNEISKDWDRIIMLQLDHMKLDAFPAQILELKQLELLNLHGNFDISSIPPEITKLDKLETINFSGLNISAFPIEVLDFPNLRRLRLSKTRIKSIPSGVLPSNHAESLRFTLDISDTPACSQSAELIAYVAQHQEIQMCQHLCGGLCHKPEKLNHQCRMECISPECNYDGVCGQEFYQDLIGA